MEKMEKPDEQPRLVRRQQTTNIIKQFIFNSTGPTATILKEISNRKYKANQIKSKEKLKRSCFGKLAVKLEEELSELKNHHTAEAREKWSLLEKCRNQKHIRSSVRLSMNNTLGSFHRPQTGTKSQVRYSKKPKVTIYCKSFVQKIENIKQECAAEQEKLEELKDNIDTAFYYCKLVNGNSNRILSKML